SRPPQTFGIVRPASLATSTKTTCGGARALGSDFVSRIARRCHFPRGVVNPSTKVAPKVTTDEPRKRRRGRTKLIACAPVRSYGERIARDLRVKGFCWIWHAWWRETH